MRVPKQSRAPAGAFVAATAACFADTVAPAAGRRHQHSTVEEHTAVRVASERPAGGAKIGSLAPS